MAVTKKKSTRISALSDNTDRSITFTFKRACHFQQLNIFYPKVSFSRNEAGTLLMYPTKQLIYG